MEPCSTAQSPCVSGHLCFRLLVPPSGMWSPWCPALCPPLSNDCLLNADPGLARHSLFWNTLCKNHPWQLSPLASSWIHLCCGIASAPPPQSEHPLQVFLTWDSYLPVSGSSQSTIWKYTRIKTRAGSGRAYCTWQGEGHIPILSSLFSLHPCLDLSPDSRPSRWGRGGSPRELRFNDEKDSSS